MYVRRQRTPEGTSTLIERPGGWQRLVQESAWGEVAARREGSRRAAAGPGLCAEGGWGSDGWQRGRRLKVAVVW